MDAETKDSFDGDKQADVLAQAQEALAQLVNTILDDSAALSLQVELD
jgi:hypothetical protein